MSLKAIKFCHTILKQLRKDAVLGLHTLNLKSGRERLMIANHSFSVFYPCLGISRPYQESVAINSQRQIENVPNEIKIDKNHQIVLESEMLGNLEKSQYENILEKFNLKGLKLLYFDKYKVSTSKDRHALFFPLEDALGNLVAVQYLAANSCSNEHITERIFPSENDIAMFGWSSASLKQEDIVITSHPLDALTVNQEAHVQAMSVPFNSLFHIQIVKLLESFKKVVLWLSCTQHSWKLHKLFSEKLGKKAYFIRPTFCSSTALLSLQNGDDLKKILNMAYPLKHESVETFSAYKEATYHEFKDFQKSSGMKWKRYPVLNDLLKGLRKGELTIFSGQTGTGKTTFMSEYSLDLCMQGLPTLWGSFEISNTRLLKTMMTQFSLCSLKDDPEKYHQWANEFDKLPMFFMNFCGQNSLKDVIEAMRHTVIVYGIEHVVIDNLQFMMNSEDLNSIVDHLRRQDQIFGAFRQFATQHNCHVTVVMHPRKEPEFSELNNTSISGSAKAIQEADNILLLQTTKSKQYLQLTKNRFDGQKGYVILEFDKKNLTFHIRKASSNSKPLFAPGTLDNS